MDITKRGPINPSQLVEMLLIAKQTLQSIPVIPGDVTNVSLIPEH
jgi:hypothetical protein